MHNASYLGKRASKSRPGVPVIQNEKLIQPETFTANISFTRYLKAENYTFLSVLYERQNLTYEKSNVPLSDALLLAGYMQPLRIGRRSKPLTPNARIRFQHFGTCPTWANEKSNFSTLAQVGQRVKRRLSGRYLCLKTSFFIACFVHNPDMKSICPRRIGAFAFLSTPKTSDLMKLKIGCGLLALLVCVQALAAPNAQAWERRRLAVSPARQFLISTTLMRLPCGESADGAASTQAKRFFAVMRGGGIGI